MPFDLTLGAPPGLVAFAVLLLEIILAGLCCALFVAASGMTYFTPLLLFTGGVTAGVLLESAPLTSGLAGLAMISTLIRGAVVRWGTGQSRSASVPACRLVDLQADPAAITAVDPAIRELVLALNLPGACATIASCEGHQSVGPPYVYFWSSVAFAGALHSRLTQDWAAGQPALGFLWELRGMFHPDGRLCFMLAPSPLSVERATRWYHHLGFGWADQRHRFDRDFAVLAQWCRELPRLAAKPAPAGFQEAS